MKSLVDVRPGEGAPLAWAGGTAFAVLSGYYVLRPARDALGLSASAREMPQLFYGTFVATFLFSPVFAALVSRVRPGRLVPTVYAVVTATLVLFAFLLGRGSHPLLVAKAFFVWTSVINLLLLSILWALLTEIFSKEQAIRLFGVVGGFGTLGAIAGSLFTSAFARELGPSGALLASSALFGVATASCARLGRLTTEGLTTEDLTTEGLTTEGNRAASRADARGPVVAGGVLRWFERVATEPYLRALVVYMLAFTMTSTFVYLEQGNIVRAAALPVGERTAFFARIDLASNVLTAFVQWLLTARVIRRLGLGGVLVLLPVSTALSFGVITAVPTLPVLTVVQSARRTLEHALTRPAREVLFTTSNMTDRYKAKPFLDTFVYRSGDALGASVFESISRAFGVAGLLGVALPLCAAWTAAGAWLGRHARNRLAR